MLSIKATAQEDTQTTERAIDSATAFKKDSALPFKKDSVFSDSSSVTIQDTFQRSADTLILSPSTLNLDIYGKDSVMPSKKNIALIKKNISWQNDTGFQNFLRFSGLEIKKIVQPVTRETALGETDTASRKVVHVKAINRGTMNEEMRPSQSKDPLFYTLAALFLFLAFIKTAFSKYFHQVFSLSFQTAAGQKQTREQLLQNRLPAFLMNLLFIFSGSLLITLLAQYFKWITMTYWWLLLYAAVILAAIYIIKYLFINFTGWVFNARQSAGAYSFIVFIINKILGVVLLPMLVIIAFADENIKSVTITIMFCIIIFLFLYRYLFSLTTIRKNLDITAFHFFIYLCAVEILPLLIIYKVFFSEIKSN